MKKRLIKLGSSYALIINKTLLEMLKIDPDDEVELVTDGKALLIRQVHDEQELVRTVAKRKNVKQKGKK